MHVILAIKKDVKIILVSILALIGSTVIFLCIYKSSLGVFFGNNKKLPIYNVDTSDKKVAITFDSSWGNDNTLKILDVLDKYKAKATFFLIGRWCDEYPNETKEIAKRGNEIGNHSNKHPDMTNISKAQIGEDIKKADEKIAAITGKKPKIFRCPSGSYNNSVIEVVEKTNHKCIQWDVDSIDWKEQGRYLEYKRVIGKVKPGSIILFHNNAKYTPENLDRILKELKGDGYSFVTVSDLIYKSDYHIDYNGKQIKNN